jgi:tetratricopeptide (TPR) repeat protein
MVGRKAAKGAGLAALPDVEFMQTWLARVGVEAADLATDAAQQIIYDAWEAQHIAERHRLALAALDQSPLCGDAFNILAGIMPEHAAALFERGMVAAELALGPQRFAEYEGEFWRHLETRPYMRARAGLADEMLQAGKSDEAIAHWHELLRLCPGDNLGVRYLLTFELLQRRDRRALRTLLKSYRQDDGPILQYTRALLAFEANEHIPFLLAATSSIVSKDSGHLSMGGLDEAVFFVHHAGEAWRETDGACEWLLAVCEVPARAARMARARARLG